MLSINECVSLKFKAFYEIEYLRELKGIKKDENANFERLLNDFYSPLEGRYHELAEGYKYNNGDKESKTIETLISNFEQAFLTYQQEVDKLGIAQLSSKVKPFDGLVCVENIPFIPYTASLMDSSIAKRNIKGSEYIEVEDYISAINVLKDYDEMGNVKQPEEDDAYLSYLRSRYNSNNKDYAAYGLNPQRQYLVSDKVNELLKNFIQPSEKLEGESFEEYANYLKMFYHKYYSQVDDMDDSIPDKIRDVDYFYINYLNPREKKPEESYESYVKDYLIPFYKKYYFDYEEEIAVQKKSK